MMVTERAELVFTGQALLVSRLAGYLLGLQ